MEQHKHPCTFSTHIFFFSNVFDPGLVEPTKAEFTNIDLLNTVLHYFLASREPGSMYSFPSILDSSRGLT